MFCFFFFQAEDGIRDVAVTGVQTCALPISPSHHPNAPAPSRALVSANRRLSSTSSSARDQVGVLQRQAHTGLDAGRRFTEGFRGSRVELRPLRGLRSARRAAPGAGPDGPDASNPAVPTGLV